MEGWPSINAPRDWVRSSSPFTGPGEGPAAARSHAAKPSTPPLSHPVGDSCGANEPGEATPPCHVGRTAGDSVSVVSGGKVTDDLFVNVRSPCKQPQQTLCYWVCVDMDENWRFDSSKWCFLMPLYPDLICGSWGCKSVLNQQTQASNGQIPAAWFNRSWVQVITSG